MVGMICPPVLTALNCEFNLNCCWIKFISLFQKLLKNGWVNGHTSCGGNPKLFSLWNQSNLLRGIDKFKKITKIKKKILSDCPMQLNDWIFEPFCFLISRDLSRDDCKEEFIKRIWSSGLVWAVGLQSGLQWLKNSQMH